METTEVKIDKRTKAYKESLEQPSPSDTVEDTTVVAPSPDEVVAAVKLLESDEVVAAVKLLESTVTPPAQDSDEPPIPVQGIRTDLGLGIAPITPHQQAAGIAIATKLDLLHCPGCGNELLEDERNSKGPAYCRECVWKKYK